MGSELYIGLKQGGGLTFEASNGMKFEPTIM